MEILRTETSPGRPPPERHRRGRKWQWALFTVLTLTVAIGIASFFVDEPLRRFIEKEMNRRLDGYTVSIDRLSFHPLGLSLTFYDLVFRQDAHPEPAVLSIPQLGAGVQWRALLHRAVVADFKVGHPQVHLNLKQLRSEARDAAPVSERGWQEAFEAMYPLKVNQVEIIDGEVTYIDEGPLRPLRLSRVSGVVDNIRNLRSRERVYPSEFELDAVVFDRGRVSMEGNADFLAKPHLGVRSEVSLAGVELDYFHPILRRENVAIRDGTLWGRGTLEFAPTVKKVDAERLTVAGVEIDYIQQAAGPGVTAKGGRAVEATSEVADEPGLVLRVREARLRDSTLGIVNRSTRPNYRLFLSDAEVSVKGLSNSRAEGAATVDVRGRFMGSGKATAHASFRPGAQGPDVDLQLAVDDSRLTALNDFFRGYVNTDFADGNFSIYSEVTVREGRLEGYLKPLASGVRVYDREQDVEDGFWQRTKERVLGFAAKLLRNEPRREVATVVHFSGSLEEFQYSKWQTFTRFLSNAFIRAILPGFEQEEEQPRSRERAKA